jgi:transposase
MKNYQTDLSDNQWQFIKKNLRLAERKQTHNLRSIWSAIHYLVKTGYHWRMLPLNLANGS